MGNKILSWVSAISIILCIISVGYIIRINCWYYLPYKQYTGKIDFQIDYTRPIDISYESIKEDIDLLFNNPNYTLNIEDIDVSGRANLLTTTIVLDEGLSYENYVFTLAHELVHITYFTVNERFSNFTAWKILYESGNDYFKNVALAFARDDMYISADYHFVAYVVDYLNA